MIRTILLSTLLLAGALSLQGGVIVDLETATGATSQFANPGDTVSLHTLLTTTSGEQVGSLSYTISLTPVDWVLQSRTYDLGWSPVFFDVSTPPQGAPAAIINPLLYAATPLVPDFSFDNSLALTNPLFLIGVEGADVAVETFSITIPPTTTPAIYTLTLSPIGASDGNGFVDLTPALAGPRTFQLFVGVVSVPEPATSALLALMLGSLLVALKRRKYN